MDNQVTHDERASLVKRLKRLADEPVGRDDGYTYVVPARNLVEYSEAMENAAALIEADGKRLALADSAPHMEYCQFSYLSGAENIRCTCWKAEL